ncbi:hypothetical protein V2H45_15880 [Tumidithrix elongata RA019]|uniref:Uncharacterized protein n=1 Tax=Tumidithrix elongata BACA0141 TaxID=2716417 RepID=A0AAW9Q0T5_9CYAN|nr:hypothetical protein [Tumidithrix elongata RA019]
MNNSNSDRDRATAEDMLPEYDFSEGVRGKHYKAYQKGHTVKIHQPDGSVNVQHFTLEEGAIMLDPDVRKYFPDAASVNHALRTLITLFPNQYDTLSMGKQNEHV